MGKPACKDCRFYRGPSRASMFATSACLNPAAKQFDRVEGTYTPSVVNILGEKNHELLAKCDKKGWFEKRPPSFEIVRAKITNADCSPWWKFWP